MSGQIRHSPQPSMEKPPYVPVELLDSLVPMFRDELPDRPVPREELGVLVGQQRVMRTLLQWYLRQNGSPYVQREGAKAAPAPGHGTDGGPAP